MVLESVQVHVCFPTLTDNENCPILWYIGQPDWLLNCLASIALSIVSKLRAPLVTIVSQSFSAFLWLHHNQHISHGTCPLS